jgi:hypothetical protein
MEVSCQFHSPVTLSPGKETPLPIGHEAGWEGPKALARVSAYELKRTEAQLITK